VRRLRKPAVTTLAAAAVLAPDTGSAAAPPTQVQARAAVAEIARGHARACRLSVDRIAAEPIGDPAVPAVTIGWRVEASVRRFGEGRLRTVAVWRVDSAGAHPDSPLAGQLAVGCAHVDPPPPATAAEWHSLPYLAEDGSLYLTGNEGWAGSTSTVPAGRSELSLAEYPWGERFRFVWGASCTAKPQDVSLRRLVYLPGAPAAATASLASLAVRTGAAAMNPVRSLRLLVNGRVAMEVRGSAALPARLPRDALRLFVDGPNQLELQASKRASLRCNAGPRSLQIGIAFELKGRFRSSLATALHIAGTHRAGSAFYARVARATNGRVGSLRFGIRNAGPSAAPAATFTLDLTGDARIAFVARTLARSVSGCEAADATADLSRPPPYRIVCSLTDLPAHVTLPLELRYRFGSPTPFGQRVLRLAWSLESAQASAPARGGATLVFCGSLASWAGCRHAPS
jgi:hypothetical protein